MRSPLLGLNWELRQRGQSPRYLVLEQMQQRSARAHWQALRLAKVQQQAMQPTARLIAERKQEQLIELAEAEAEAEAAEPVQVLGGTPDR